MMTLYYVVFGIIFVSIINYLIAMVGSIVYNLQQKKLKSAKEYPSLSVVITAYNEEEGIARCIEHVLASHYPREKLQVIVADDGSTDRTREIAERYPVIVFHQTNQGKASALNHAIRQVATNEIVVVIDGDSYPSLNALKNLAKRFEDKTVSVVASNIRIAHSGSFLSLIQYYEYVINWFSKRGTNALNVDCIVGGIGSAFRYSDFIEVGGYSKDVIVEDIDFTFKILKAGKKIVFAHDSIMFAPPVYTFKDLLKQRFRWKFGYIQSLWKYRSMIGRRSNSNQRTLLYLPFAVIRELVWFIEPLVPISIVLLLVFFADFFSIITAVAVVSTLTSLQILLEDTLTKQQRKELILIAPVMYFGMYVISLAWYIVTFKALLKIKHINYMHSRWTPVARKA